VILVDTSIWADHFRSRDAMLDLLLVSGRAMIHPYVIGELAVGHLRQRDTTLLMLGALPRPKLVREGDLLAFIDGAGISGSGLGFVDASLLASCSLTRNVWLWSRDKKLVAKADTLKLVWQPA
jgi:predicted nucleic acid-binding protein